jgi:ring-1,2-phenylacetyl-CoA epoxidase subunit PaaD
MTYEPEQIETWLHAVKDPEIPVLSLVDLGIINEIDCRPDGSVMVAITPTFSGCPAIDHMQSEIVEVLKGKGIDATCVVNFDIPWSSDRITAKGLEALSAFGLALPGSALAVDDLDLLEQATCPFCNSTQTVMKSMFGPTQCRSLHYCDNCKQAFERFKPL